MIVRSARKSTRPKSPKDKYDENMCFLTSRLSDFADLYFKVQVSDTRGDAACTKAGLQNIYFLIVDLADIIYLHAGLPSFLIKPLTKHYCHEKNIHRQRN